jgi:RNA polymerase sigma-70 factor (ECF subfamily)
MIDAAATIPWNMASDPPADEKPLPNRCAAIDWPRALTEHRPWLRAVVLARVGDSHAADDVLQEVALAVVRQGPRLYDNAKVAPWLYRVAVRQALIYRRKAGRRRKRHDALRREHETAPDDAGPRDPLQWLLSRERREVVRGALGRLDDRDAEILVLKYAEDWSYRQIAANLGVSESAVESRLHRARKKLRDALADVIQD